MIVKGGYRVPKTGGLKGSGSWAPSVSRLARAVGFLRTHPTRRAGWNWVIWTVLLLMAVSLVTHAGGSTTSAAASGPVTAPMTSIPSHTADATPSASTKAAAATDAVTTSMSPAARPSPSHTGGLVLTNDGAILPNPQRTPGAVNPAVSQDTISSTICRAGWTNTIRPPSSYTTALKEQQLATGYAYRGDSSPGDYEEDHLISLELGGSPTDAANLWPEPYAATDGARTKDRIENRLHNLVCAGTISLSTAQHAIAINWWQAYTTYHAAPSTAPGRPTTAAPPAQPPVSSTSSAAPPPVANPGDGATALCNDGTYSYAAHHQGACSHHGGVKIFYK